jgi:two-component system response regulator HydG
MTSAAQAKVLRVLQEGEVERVGGADTIKVDVRVVAATNRQLEREVNSGRFREDLYYRLSVVPISIPPLRDRGDDAPLLARLFVERVGRKLGKKAHLSQAGEKEIARYGWPGNVRELMNAIERAVLLARTEEIGPDELALPKARDVSGQEVGLADLNLRIPSDGVSLVAVEKAVIVGALARTHGNVVEAAKLLHIGRGSLRCKMRRHGIGREEPVRVGAV